MGFDFENLDDRTRRLMIDEVDRDVADGTLYESVRLTTEGTSTWEPAFRAACQSGDEATLTSNLGVPGGRYVKAREPNSRSTSGEDKDVPYNAATTMAEGEFNRFYIRALCVRAVADGATLEIYRARPSQHPSAASEAKVGRRPDPAALLADLRSHQGVATALGLPSHPNSGLSVRLTSLARS